MEFRGEARVIDAELLVQRRMQVADVKRMLRRAVKGLGLPTAAEAMTRLPKSDGRKVVIASLLRENIRARH